MHINNDIDKVFCASVAAAMGAAVNQVLWAQRQLWLPVDAGKPIVSKAGGGQATYFKPQRHVDTIVFGKKMVASKCTGFAGQWLSYREIIRFHYFDGIASPLNLMAHTVCHEFAHYLQAYFKQRRKGEVHTHDFYRYLSEIHANGLAEQVRQFLQQALPRLAGLEIAEPLSVATKPQVLPALKAGDRVYFNYQGERVVATAVRINRKTVSAKALKGHGRWRVPYHLLLK